METSETLFVYLLLALCSNLSRCDLIDSVAEQDVYDAAEEALQAADDNAVAVCFANEAGFGLTNVQSYAYYGDFEDFLEFDVAVGQTSITLHNNNLNLVGTSGMISYDIFGTDYKAVVAYYTPFNDLLYDNQFNMKIYEQSAGTNENIFKHMLSDKAAWFESVAGVYALRTEYGIEMRAVMNDEDKATMALFLDTSGQNPFEGPDLNYGCDYDGLFDKKCWRECDANNPGWQWTTEACWTNDDCENPNELTPDSECMIDGPW